MRNWNSSLNRYLNGNWKIKTKPKPLFTPIINLFNLNSLHKIHIEVVIIKSNRYFKTKKQTTRNNLFDHLRNWIAIVKMSEVNRIWNIWRYIKSEKSYSISLYKIFQFAYATQNTHSLHCVDDVRNVVVKFKFGNIARVYFRKIKIMDLSERESNTPPEIIESKRNVTLNLLPLELSKVRKCSNLHFNYFGDNSKSLKS